VPIPVGLVSCAELYPPHPARDLLGRPTPFDAARHHAFQGLLQRFGDAGQRRVKAATISAVRSGGPPPATGDPVAGARDPLGRAAVAVALRQLAHTDAGRSTRPGPTAGTRPPRCSTRTATATAADPPDRPPRSTLRIGLREPPEIRRDHSGGPGGLERSGPVGR
jgi:hypothetical protein